MRRPIIFTTLLLPLALLLAAGWFLRPAHRPQARPTPLKTGFYIWQQNWSPPVGEAARLARDKAERFYIYAARLELAGEEVRPSLNRPDWAALARAARPVVLVVRAPEGLARLLVAGRAEAVAVTLATLFEQLRREAGAAGCAVTGLQLDYDCPTARLDGYRALLEALRGRIGRAELSITALPTWLESRQFGPLVQGLPYYVLQVHGVERPTTIDRPIVLCDSRRIIPWVRRAASIGIPFYVALPTYGYRAVFDDRGQFAALLAEGPQATLRPGYQERMVLADPAEMAAAVRKLRQGAPPECRGVIWFRLPIVSDQLNWPWPTLAAVAEGREPRAAFAAEVRNPSPGLYEVWAVNRGERDAAGKLKIPLTFGVQKILAHDVMKGFDEDDQGALCGPAPPLGAPRLAAWYRLAPPYSQEPLKLGEVQVLP